MAGPRGEYRKTAERRTQILDAALEVFSKNGYTASSVNEIARVVGISQTGVLHHFTGGKMALLRAVLERRDAAARELLGDKQGRDFLRAMVEVSRTQRAQRGVVQLYTILAAEATDPDHPAHAYFTERFQVIADAVTRAYEQVRSDGGLREGVDPRRAALSSLASIEGLQLLWLDGLDVDIAEDSARLISSFLIEPI
ncbi:TetR/AcrR family transcriptional regulator [Microbacterium stercoris]|uniref:TetR/AcrR family transcriptional regulator n=1 Tax=Microbacterium stercoris TaxID=2820289 RepID=A0A939TSD2_9MICO|nr:TetR/AcrR family transcriptional regulator [Microbacterium stercoris]MBO3665071.1 TetR/AcrR family transcriptional regulator [Microbacterium stercoris]